MGTVFSIDVRAPGVDRRTVDEVVQWLHQVDAIFSTYRDDSAINRIARSELVPAAYPHLVREVLARCTELQVETGGYFDCRASGRLDPSGYVKGWAIERASAILVAGGSRNHCVNGGGDVQCVGQAAPGRDWVIGIADPTQPGQIIASVPGRDIAVATSGTSERAAHIVDPLSRRRPDTYASITVVGRHLADVDAYATAAFAMGEAAEAWLRNRELAALLVRPDGRTTRL